MTNVRDQILVIIKLLFFFVLLVISIAALYLRLFFTSPQSRQLVKFKARKNFCRRTNSLFGIRVILDGPLPPPDTYLYISNHRSFYDPIVFLSQFIANPVSKAEVSRYPIIGWGARLTEVLMLDRHNRKERGLMKIKIFENLRDGTSILLYPEGTTTDREWTGTFKRGAFESAVRAGRKVVPIAMEYPDESFYWIDQPLFAQFVYQVSGRNDNRVFIAVGEPIWNSDVDTLLNAVQHSIHQKIEILRSRRS